MDLLCVVARAPVFEVCAEVVLIPVGVSGVHHGLEGLSVLKGLSGRGTSSGASCIVHLAGWVGGCGQDAQSRTAFVSSSRGSFVTSMISWFVIIPMIVGPLGMARQQGEREM